MKKCNYNNHRQLKALKSLWNLPDDILNNILHVNTSTDDFAFNEGSVGLASRYIDFMLHIVCTNDPSEAWHEWCLLEGDEDEINDNPYI